MANLKDIAKSKGIEIHDRVAITPNPQFQKRRSWMLEEDNRTKQNTTEQNKTEQVITEQDQTKLNSETEQNKTSLHIKQDNILNKTKLNKTEQESTPEEKLVRLSGNRKKVVFSIYENLLENNATEIETSYKMWSEISGVGQSSIKTTVRNLKIDGYFQITSPRGGRSATVVVSAESDLLIAYSKNQTKLNKQLNKQLNKNLANSSNNIFSNKEILTTISFEIPENLKSIVSQKELVRLIETKMIDEEYLNQSLIHFSYDYQNNLVKSKGSPINLLFGLLRSGRKYNSLKLIEIENEDLKNYNSELLKLNQEKEKLREESLRLKYKEFLIKNPDYLSKIKATSNFDVSESVLENLAFSKFCEEQSI